MFESLANLNLFIPGAFGGAMMIFAFNKLLDKLNKSQMIILIILATFLGAYLLGIGLENVDSFITIRFSCLLRTRCFRLPNSCVLIMSW